MIADIGIDVHVAVGTHAIERLADAAVRVLLSDGTVIDAGVVVFAAGVRPRDDLAVASDLPGQHPAHRQLLRRAAGSQR